MTKSYKVNKIEDIVKIGKTLTHSWFRGQSQAWELKPRVFRSEFLNMRPEIEFILMDEFKKISPPILKELPKSNLDWLFLMQHHGLPTRLLDWTESPLIALYFAVSRHDEKPGELWALNPDALNKQGIDIGLPSIDNPYLQYLAEEPFILKEIDNKDRTFNNSNRQLLDRLGVPQAPKSPIAFRPPKNFPRMVSQLSAFTIHPNPRIDPNAKNIADSLIHGNNLVRYIIPSRCKRSLLKDLFSLGISRGTIFQDLDSLCDDVVNLAKDIDQYNARMLPEPPECGGEIFDNELID